MPQRPRLSTTRKVRRLGLGKSLLVLLLAAAGSPTLTGAALGPGPDPILVTVAEPRSATLALSGTDVVITGSIDHIFASESFVGPNRASKQDRARIDVGLDDFTAGFDAPRIALAKLMAPPPAVQGLVGGAGLPAPGVEVAAIGPGAAEAALNAINSFAPDAVLPMAPSEELAYARATAPETDFTQPASVYSEKELWCLGTAIYFEARGESYRGQVAVAQVVMNRVAHRLYPDTICGVVFQGESRRNACQFSFACDGHPETINDKKSWAQAQEIALKVSTGELYIPEVANATHYHANYVYPHWAPRLTKLTQVGLHIFYKFKRA